MEVFKRVLSGDWIWSYLTVQIKTFTIQMCRNWILKLTTSLKRRKILHVIPNIPFIIFSSNPINDCFPIKSNPLQTNRVMTQKSTTYLFHTVTAKKFTRNIKIFIFRGRKTLNFIFVCFSKNNKNSNLLMLAHIIYFSIFHSIHITHWIEWGEWKRMCVTMSTLWHYYVNFPI